MTMADEHASFQEVTVVSLKTITRFCSMLLLLALILTPAGSVRAAPGNTTRVSVASDGTQSNHDSYNPSISADGRYVAFESEATNLVSGDTNNFRDIFVTTGRPGRLPASQSLRMERKRMAIHMIPPSPPTGAMWRLHHLPTTW
jgi:hypothetical protein